MEGDSAAGCLSENVLVPLLDGRTVSFPTLIDEYKQGKENYCYTIKNDGTVGVGEVRHPRITKHGAEIVAVHLDNGSIIEAQKSFKFSKETQNTSKFVGPKAILLKNISVAGL